MAAVGANPGLFFIHFHTAVLGGEGVGGLASLPWSEAS